MDYTYQGIDSFAHVCRARTQIIAHGVVKAEHAPQGFASELPSTDLLFLFRSEPSDRWGTTGSHRWKVA